MTTINRQKFLTELGKLLTFMYEEDRQRALSLYAEMFDAADDDQAVIQALMSPTRQAVLVARAYNNSRGMSVDSRYNDEKAESEAPKYVTVIENIRDGLISDIAGKAAETDEDQISFDDLFESAAEAAVSDTAEPSAEESEPDTYSPVTEDTVILPTEDAAAEGSEAPSAPETDPDEEISGEEPAAEAPPAEEIISDGEPAAAPDAVPETEDEESSEEDPGDADAVDTFLSEYQSPVDNEPSQSDTEEGSAEEETETEPEAAPAPAVPEKKLRKQTAKKAGPAEPGQTEVHTVKKTRWFLLVLYCIFAIPIGIVGTAFLIIPTLLCLAVAALLIFAGVCVVSAAFSGFTILADLLVVIGAAIILLAFGLLFLWFFIWFIGGAISSLIGGLVSLGKKWCIKEVKIDG